MTDKPLTEAERRLALPPGAYPFDSHYAAIDGASLALTRTKGAGRRS